MELLEDRVIVLKMLSECNAKDKELMLLPDDLTTLPDDFKMYVAKHKGETIGCAYLLLCEDDSVQAAIYVMPRFRFGYGYLLMEALDDEARKIGGKVIFSPVREDNKNMLYLCDKHNLITKPSDSEGIVLKGKVL